VSASTDRQYVRRRLNERFAARQKLGLAFEILGSYARQRRRLTRSKLPEVLEEIRRPLASAPSSTIS
jgi:hypothetical protein